MSFTILNLAALTGSMIDGDEGKSIDAVATLKDAKTRNLTFLVNKKYLEDAKHTKAGAIILSPSNWKKLKESSNSLACKEHHTSSKKSEKKYLSCAKDLLTNVEDKNFCQRSYLIHPNPYAAFALIVQHIVSKQEVKSISGIDPRAVISPEATIAAGAVISPFVTIEAGAVIGENVYIGSHSFIGKNVSVAAESKIFSNVSIYHDCHLGKRCIIHSGVVIGADGFGFAPDFETQSPDPSGPVYSYKPSGKWLKLPQLGEVRISDDVEIGANSTIDRGALADTIIECGVKIDNLVQIAHNCKIGAHTVIAACTGIAGSTTIGRYCMLGGAVGIAGHLFIGDRVVITGKSSVSKSLMKPGIYGNTFPAVLHTEWNRSVVSFRNIQKLHERIKQLETQLAAKAG